VASLIHLPVNSLNSSECCYERLELCCYWMRMVLVMGKGKMGLVGKEEQNWMSWLTGSEHCFPRRKGYLLCPSDFLAGNSLNFGGEAQQW